MVTPNPLNIHCGKFSTIESKLREYPIIGVDTEDDSKGTPVLFGMYGDFKEQSYVTKFSDELLSRIYDIEETTIFVCHNLEYDMANIFKDSDYLVIDRMVYASGLLKVTMAGTTHYFLNSHSYFRGPVKAMAKFVGLEKLEGDPLGSEYMLMDCKIPYTFVKMLQKKLVNEIGVNLGVTIGKMSMDTYRRSYMQDKTQVTYNSPNCLKAYFGGRVEIFKKGESHNINVVDINSCYPFVMKEFEYPDTSTIEPSTIGTHHFGIGKFKVYVPEDTFLPVLPFKSDEGRLFFPIGEFTGWWTYAEVRHAVEHGTQIIKEYEGEGTNKGVMPFSGFIDTFYELRQDAKARLEKNSDDVQADFDNLFYKLWLNNLYGKWCQHKASNEMTREKWPFWKLEKNRENADFKEIKVGPFYNYTVPKDKPPITANFMWGIYVTSYSRIYLHRGLLDVHSAGHTLLYCDTDSIMYCPNNNSVPFKLSNNLGEWDLEKYDLGIFRQAKGYLLCDKKGKDYEIKKVACKGVPTHYAYDFIIDGMASFLKPMRLKESLIRVNAEVNKNKSDEFLKDIGENVWKDVEKSMRKIYVKRSGETITYPIFVQDIADIEKNSQNLQLSIKKDLEKNEIRIKKKPHKNKFENTVIPVGYFDRSGGKIRKPRLFISQKVHDLTTRQCMDLVKGQIWFCGDVLQIRSRKTGKQYYHIFITHYKGHKINAHFWGGISMDFFKRYGMSENLLNKKVAVTMCNNYVSDKLLELSIKITESKNKGLLDTEKIDTESKLNKKQLETLMSLDWSKFNERKK